MRGNMLSESGLALVTDDNEGVNDRVSRLG
jgi:hypothetical protein